MPKKSSDPAKVEARLRKLRMQIRALGGLRGDGLPGGEEDIDSEPLLRFFVSDMKFDARDAQRHPNPRPGNS